MARTCRTLPVAQTSEERVEFLKTLPKLSATELQSGDHCPICLTPFTAILEDDSGTLQGRSGVTKLQCGHVFCMADISEWIHTSRGSCPTCRDLFLLIPEPVDDESSDGGEYIPGSDSITDDMMDAEAWTDETWTDEEADAWTDGEMSLDEVVTEGETSSSDISSEGLASDVEGCSSPAMGLSTESSIDTAIISEGGEGPSSMNAGNGGTLSGDRFVEVGIIADDPDCEHINAELVQWRALVAPIQLCDWVSRKEETRSMIHQGFCALNALKPRIGAVECDTPAKLSFVHYALATLQELHREMRLKLDMVHDIDRYWQESHGRGQIV